MRTLSRPALLLTAILLILVIPLSLLTAVKAEASTLDGVPTAGKYLSASTVMQGLGERHPLEFSTYAQYVSCASGPQYPHVMLLNKDTGQQFWNGRYSNLASASISGTYGHKVSYDKADTIIYPGGTIQAFMYDRYDSNCNPLPLPDPATSTPRVISEEVEITWESMNLFEAYFGEDGAKVSTDLHSSLGGGTPTVNGGISSFAIANYGLSNQQVYDNNSRGGECVYESPSSSICTEEGAERTDVDVYGFALIPSTFPAYSGSQWPPPGAIDSALAFKSEIGGPQDIPLMTKGGPSESAQCLRICSGDPIDTYSGNFFEKKDDLSISGRIGINIQRHYSVGNLGSTGAFGNGWTLGYDMRIDSSQDNTRVTVIEPSGNHSPFSLDETSEKYLADTPVLHASLIKTPAGWEFKRWKENTTHYFSGDGKLERIVDNNGNSVSLERYADGKIKKVSEGSRWVSLVWEGPLLSKVTDHAGREVSYLYNVDSALQSVVLPDGSSSQYSYDASGRVINMTDANGGVTTNVYNAAGKVVQQFSPTGRVINFTYGVPDAYGQVTNTEKSGTVTKTYAYTKGRISSVSDSSDRAKDSWYYYNLKGELVSTTYADETVHRVKFAYDSNGNVIRSEDTANGALVLSRWNDKSQLVWEQSADGILRENTYDLNGNLTQEKLTPSDGSASRVTNHTVSSIGDRIATVNPLGGNSTMEYSSDGDILSLTDSVGGKTTYAYDSLGRLLKKTSPGGNIVGITEAEAHKFSDSYVYGANDAVLSVTTQSGRTTYGYDKTKHPTSITDPRGKTKTAEYNADGKVTSITYPDGSKDTFTYDASTGGRATWTDSKQRTTKYSQTGTTKTTISPDNISSTITTNVVWSMNQIRTYLTDPTSQNVQIAQTTPKSGWMNLGTRKDTFTFDMYGRTKTDVTANGNGTYAFDGFGNLSSQASTVAGRNISYQYDVAGNITKITYPDGTSVARSLDTAGRTVKLTDWSGVEYLIAYSTDGDVNNVSSSTGLRYETKFDGSRATEKRWMDSLDQTMAVFGTTFDESGMVISDTKTTGDLTGSRVFTWGDNGTLTGVNGESIGWDGKYLTSNESVHSMIYNPASGQLSSAVKKDGTNLSFTYDSRGNRNSMANGASSMTYTWDTFNRMMSAGSDTYSYGINGLRTKVNTNQQVYGQDGKLLSDGTNKYLWGADGALLAQAPLGAGTGTTPSQAVTDHMGTVHAVVQHGLVPDTTDQYKFTSLAEYSYTAFGERKLVAGSDVTPMGFVSEQHDASGLIYLRARYYDPMIGQFISHDPLVNKTLDAYGYAGGNPLQMIDPLGLDFFGDVGSLATSSFNNGINWVRDNPDQIATGLQVLAIVASATGVGAPVGLALGALSMGFGLYSAHQNAAKGDVVGTVEDIAGIIPGVKFLGATWGVVRATSKFAKKYAKKYDDGQTIKNFAKDQWKNIMTFSEGC